MAHLNKIAGHGGTWAGQKKMSRFGAVALTAGQGGTLGVPPLKGGNHIPNVPPVPSDPLGGSATLVDLANRVSRLAPSRHDPEAFHVEKDEIARTLRRLANG